MTLFGSMGVAVGLVPSEEPPEDGAGQWARLNVGAGGWLTGLDVQGDADECVMASRADTFGGFVGNGTGAVPWQQILSAETMPSDDVRGWRRGTQADPSHQNPWLAAGIYDVRIAPSDRDVLWAIMCGSDTPQVLYRSMDRAQSWARAGTGWVTNGVAPNSSTGRERLNGQHIAVDPANAAVVYATGDYLYLTTNGTASNPADVTWGQVTDLPQPTGTGKYGIAFDAGSGTTNGRTNVVYVLVDGVAVYRGTWNGSSTTWTSLASGGPTGGYGCYVDHLGRFWTALDSGLYRISRGSTTWDTVSPSGIGDLKGVLVDPNDGNRVLLFEGQGNIGVSTNGGTSFTRCTSDLSATGDVLWLDCPPHHGRIALAGQCFGWDTVDAAARPEATDKKFWISDGVGMWWANAPTPGGQIIWHAKSIGVEQLVAADVTCPPGSDYVHLTNMDRNSMRILRDNSAFPSTYASVLMGSNTEIIYGHSIDYSRLNPAHIAAIHNYTEERSGYSLDDGASWTQFGSYPGGLGGNVIVPHIDNILIIASADGGRVHRSTNRGTNWTHLGAAYGLPDSGFIGGMFSDNPSRRLAVDGGYDGSSNRILYAYCHGGASPGLYRSLDNGDSWIRIATKIFNVQGGSRLKLRAVPGMPGHLFVAPSCTSSTSNDKPDNWNDAALFYVTGADTATVDSLTWTKVGGFDNTTGEGNGEPGDVCFGKKATEQQAYPTIYVAGWRGWAWGVHRCVDFDPDENSGTWERLCYFPMMWFKGASQAGNVDWVSCMAASPDTYGEVFIGFQGSGWAKRNGD